MVKVFTWLSMFAMCLVSGTGLFGQTAFFEEGFDGKLPDTWKTQVVVGNQTPSASWVHTTTGPAGQFPTNPLSSTTAANGWMIFDSDLNCNVAGQDSWLISSAINTTGKASVWISFETFYRSFNDRPQIRVGDNLNDLTGWATFEVFPEIRANDFGGIIEGNEELNPQVIKIDLSQAAAGKETIYFAFQFLSSASTANGGDLTGCGYSWQVDDVKLFDVSPVDKHDLVTLHPRGGVNYSTPIAMVDTMSFVFETKNFGSADQTGIDYKVEIIKDDNSLFSSSVLDTSLISGKTDTIFFEDTYVPDDSTGIYQITYSSIQDSTDVSPGNNMITREFIVHPNLYSKDDGEIVSATQPAEIQGDFWEIGNYYFIPKEGYKATEAIISVASSDSVHIGQEVFVYLYKVTEDADPNFTDDDVELIGSGSHKFVTGEGSGAVVSVDLLDIISLDTGIVLEAATEYFLMIQYTQDMFVPFSRLGYYWDISSVVKNGGWFLGGFGDEVTAFARMRIESTEIVATKELQLDDKKLHIYPNPVKDWFALVLTLDKVSPLVEISLKGIDGKNYLNNTYNGVLKDKFEFNTQNLASGTYLLTVRTEEGVKTKRIVVQH